MPESGPGGIYLFDDFFNAGGIALAETADAHPLGPFYVGGEGFEDSDAGVAYKQSDALSGVLVITSANTDLDFSFVGTDICFDVGLMGTLVLETRVRFPDLDTKAVFIGFTSVLTRDEQITDIFDAGTTTLTLTAGSMCGFVWSDELTEDEMWHVIYKGGTTTGETDSTKNETGVDAVAGEWDILRVEIDSNGTARWYVNGDLKKTVKGAVSTSTDLAACVGVGANTTELGIMDVDYLLVKANRDWTR